MRVLSALVSLLAVAPFAALAGPVRFTRRDNANNILVLRAYPQQIKIPRLLISPSEFAAVLEQLESQFYAEALQKFSESDFQNAGFSSIQVVQEQITYVSPNLSAHPP